MSSIKINSPDTNTNGTHLQGYVKATAPLLESLLGPIMEDPYGDKSLGSWVIEKAPDLKTDAGSTKPLVATIYCWKTDSIPSGQYEWHIGGTSNEALELVTEVTGLSVHTARKVGLF
jgi:hypothetical protein